MTKPFRAKYNQEYISGSSSTGTTFVVIDEKPPGRPAKKPTSTGNRVSWQEYRSSHKSRFGIVE